MAITVRRCSCREPNLLNMLKFESEKMVNHLLEQGVDISPVRIWIWIKQYDEDQFFPKIEFDYNNQELQYDLNGIGAIVETHFKTFVRIKGRATRKDLDVSEIDPLLKRIDEEIKSIYPNVFQ